MATQSPFSLLQDIFQKLPLPNVNPPSWVVDDLQRRVVLLLNHVLMQEPEAMQRLARHQDQVMQVQWRSLSFMLQASPAGLLDLTAPGRTADLTLTVTEASPLALAQGVLKGDKPAVRIAGDVQLAAEVSWLTEHVRWDLEEDLARVMGDVPAHTLAQMARTAVDGLRQFAARVSTLVPGKSS